MSDNLRACLLILKAISRIKNYKARQKILNEFNGEECIYKAIKEMAVNVVNGNIKLSRIQRTKLAKYKSFIKEAAKPTNSKLKRKRVIVQSGGFLPYLVPVVLSLLSSILAK